MPDPILFAEAFAAASALSLALTLLFGASPRAGIAAGGAVRVQSQKAVILIQP